MIPKGIFLWSATMIFALFVLRKTGIISRAENWVLFALIVAIQIMMIILN